MIRNIVCCLLISTSVLSTNAGCTPAESAEFTRVENLVSQDLQAGKTLEQIETDVAALVAGQPGADVVLIVNDALALLIDLGVLSPSILQKAKTMHAAAQAKIAARAGAPAPAK